MVVGGQEYFISMCSLCGDDEDVVVDEKEYSSLYWCAKISGHRLCVRTKGRYTCVTKALHAVSIQDFQIPGADDEDEARATGLVEAYIRCDLPNDK